MARQSLSACRQSARSCGSSQRARSVSRLPTSWRSGSSQSEARAPGAASASTSAARILWKAVAAAGSAAGSGLPAAGGRIVQPGTAVGRRWSVKQRKRTRSAMPATGGSAGGRPKAAVMTTVPAASASGMKLGRGAERDGEPDGAGGGGAEQRRGAGVTGAPASGRAAIRAKSGAAAAKPRARAVKQRLRLGEEARARAEPAGEPHRREQAAGVRPRRGVDPGEHRRARPGPPGPAGRGEAAAGPAEDAAGGAPGPERQPRPRPRPRRAAARAGSSEIGSSGIMRPGRGSRGRAGRTRGARGACSSPPAGAARRGR